MFGVCYYPEHWPQTRWQKDAQMMAELGLKYVRIGEFVWSRLEPEPGELQFEWLDAAVKYFRICRRGKLRFAFNHSNQEHILLGDRVVQTYNVTI